ncbi:MAG TPA: maleylpyruvate isomerase family mycothiol-dependent enzyme [Intrasporangium sp.]|uniref:maleylpyruvate isomerase family mycothiol-dependent enzyme n=1 Tax=Intrasporangium sp. TaxID=1925024 RepID=UPI002D779C6A|nr:maleylpyruvate isomerase family mycothiol-dependent enzyme [Intrasporangium sp.]HET7399133.1 maleylpyruvate isomerase family mycothiol-dependent enzyme [Intrasporangium sp.]
MPPSRSGSALPYLDHLAADSARFRDVLATAPPSRRVPTCPDWDCDDLLWHLGQVQWFWGEIAERGLTDPAELEAMNATREDRPPDRAGLLDLYDRASGRLHRVLSRLQPTTPLWMWADDKTAGYIRRRQAHEAMIHRLDAELTVGARTPLDCRLAADGVDEALRIMRGYEPEPGLTHVATGPTVMLATVDAMHAWTVTPVHVTGTDEDGHEVDVRRFLVSDGPDEGSAAEICGSAADLDCWLWNRPPDGEITRAGDAAALAAVEAVLGASID